MLERCTRPDCDGGLLDEEGYCETCQLMPRRTDSGDRSPSGEPPDAPAASGHSRIGAGVVYVPREPERPPTDTADPDPHVALTDRFCSNCSEPVGRSTTTPPDQGPDDGGSDGGREAGYCGDCGWPYDYRPKLHRGDLVRGQYEVEGALGYGGQGWVWLAWDNKVGQWCVLKGRRDTAGPYVEEDEASELRSLAAMGHPGIVKVHNWVRERTPGDDPPHTYLVMEHVNGRSLQQIAADREGGRLPLSHALAYLLAVMPALGYLHDHGYFYCDLKPDNVMHHDDAVTLIDLGAAWTPKWPTKRVFGTPVYRAPELEGKDPQPPSIASDIYAAGRTLAVLAFGPWRTWRPRPEHGPPHPRPDLYPVAAGYGCLWRLLERACAWEPNERFADTEEMGEALLGVLHQVTAVKTTRPKAYPSDRWGPPHPQLDPRLGWEGLPLPVLPAHPAVADVFGAATGDPDVVIDLAEKADRLSWADQATLALAHCRKGDRAAARLTIEEIDPYAGGRVGHRRYATSVVQVACAYLQGVVHLAADNPAQAVGDFERAYRAAPGEPACALALATAAEAVGNEAALQRAEALYRPVASTDPSWVAATAGLARVLARTSPDATAPARTLLDVPEAHPQRVQALALACRKVPPGSYDHLVAEAADWHVRAAGPPDGSTSDAATAELAAALYRMALEALAAGVPIDHPVGGRRPTVASLSAAVADALRRQAEGTTDHDARHRLLDEAARVRPWGLVR